MGNKSTRIEVDMPRAHGVIAEAVGRGLENFAMRYVKRKEEEGAKTVLEDPKSTPVQKALAWEKLSPGKGAGVYDSILKEKALQQKEENNRIIRNDLNGNRENVGQRAGVGSVEPNISPVEAANQMLSPQQMQMGPEEMPYGQQLPTEPITPAFQAMQNAQQQQQNAPQGTPTIEQGGLQEPPRNPNDPYADIPTEKLQQYLGATNDPSLTRQLQSIIDGRKAKERDQTKLEAAKIKGQISKEKENRDEIRNYAEPYNNIQSLEKNVRNMEKAEDIILNSDEFSFDESILRTALGAIAEDKGKDTIANLFKTRAQQKMFSLMYDSLKPKELGGSNPSTKEVLLAMSKQPTPYKGKAANAFIVGNMLNSAKVELAKGQAILEARAEHPEDFSEFQQSVNKKVAEKSQQFEKETENRVMVVEAKEITKKNPPKPGNVWMLDTNGDLKQIPGNKAVEFQAKGNIIIR